MPVRTVPEVRGVANVPAADARAAEVQPAVQTAPASETTLSHASTTTAPAGVTPSTPPTASEPAAAGVFHSVGPVGGTFILVVIVILFGVAVAGVVAAGGLRGRAR